MNKYILIEVVDGGVDYHDGTKKFLPKDAKQGEELCLRPDRIRKGTWRYGIPGEGDNILIVSGVGTLMMYNVCSNTIKDYHIILDPPAPEPMPEPMPVPDWEEEIRDILLPIISLERASKLIMALRKWKEAK